MEFIVMKDTKVEGYYRSALYDNAPEYTYTQKATMRFKKYEILEVDENAKFTIYDSKFGVSIHGSTFYGTLVDIENCKELKTEAVRYEYYELYEEYERNQKRSQKLYEESFDIERMIDDCLFGYRNPDAAEEWVKDIDPWSELSKLIHIKGEIILNEMDLNKSISAMDEYIKKI